jgi:hypothetical protein
VPALAAAAVGVAGCFHGRLCHEGYGQVNDVGPLFLLNELGSGAVIAVFLLG